VTDNREIQALIRLLDDPDELIYNHIREKLIDFGIEVIPALEEVWEHESFGMLFQNRIEDIVHQIQFEDILHQISNWKHSETHDLLQGIILIAKYQYPDLDECVIHTFFDRTFQEIWLELNNNLTALEKIRIINHMLFEEHGFTGNTTNYHSPQNSFINHVIETKRGNPISLAIIYLILAQRLNIPIYGVNLPRHFILAYADEFVFKPERVEDSSIMFYINPFSKGTVFSKREIEYFIKQLKLPSLPEYFQPCSNVQIINRVCNNLIYSYDKLGYEEKVNEIKRILDVLNE
tara:strand:- start:461 stop:1333 length:873 start_codon:yes stop_codon:yes gene_type:complete